MDGEFQTRHTRLRLLKSFYPSPSVEYTTSFPTSSPLWEAAPKLNRAKATNEPPVACKAPGGFLFLDQARGSTLLSTKVTIKPMTESAVSWSVQVRRVSFSVMPLRRDTTQNPLSFIQEQNMAPKPMAVNK